jgi:hypothetical protein
MMRVNAGRESSRVLVPTVEDSWEKLPHSWSRVSSSSSCTKDLEALFVWAKVWYIHGPQKSQVHVHPVRAKHEAAKMAGANLRLWVGDTLPPGKANVVVDALSRKSQVNMVAAHPMPYELAKVFDRLSLEFLNNTQGVTIELEPTLEKDIRKGQKDDEKINEIRQLIIDRKGKDFREDAEGVVWFKDRLCVPNIKSIRELILKEAHEKTYSIHPGSEKMYQDLKKRFRFYGMKREIAEYVAICDSCSRIKAEHQRPVGLLQPLQIPQWKWDEIGMDFIVGLPRTRAGYDSMWVVVDHLTKAAHFIPVKTTYNSAVLVELYMSRIVCLHGVPKKIVSDRGTKFTSHFWQQLHEALDTHFVTPGFGR